MIILSRSIILPIYQILPLPTALKMSSFGNKPTLFGSQIMAHRFLHCVLEFLSTFLFLREEPVDLAWKTDDRFGKLMIDLADGVDLSIGHLKNSLEPPGTLTSRGAPYASAGPSYMPHWREDKPMAQGGGNSQNYFLIIGFSCLFYNT